MEQTDELTPFPSFLHLRCSQTSTLQPSSLDLVPLLSPLLARPSPVKFAAEKLLLEGVGKFSSPREVMVAVGERLEALVEEAEAQEDDVEDEDQNGDEDEDAEEDGEEESDEGGDVEVEEEHDHDHSDPHHHHHHSSSSHPRYTPPSALASELPTLLSLLASSIPRLTSKRSLPTFLNLASMLPAAMSSVPPRPSTSRLVLDRLREVVEAARSWGTGTEDWSAKGEQKVSRQCLCSRGKGERREDELSFDAILFFSRSCSEFSQEVSFISTLDSTLHRPTALGGLKACRS